MTASARPVLYLIDGHAVAYRQFYAMQNVARRGGVMSTRAGEPTGAVLRFATILMDLVEQEHSTAHYLAVTFDRGLSGREALYPAYKNNRADMPADLVTQMKRIQQVTEAFNIPVLALEGCEADDVMGTIAPQAQAAGLDVHIITGDRDILQLLTPHVRVQLPQRGDDDLVFDEATFRGRYDGLEPRQLVDLKALMGDSSDNIPGVKGIGEKTATGLLQQYGTLDNIYAHLGDIKEALRQKLIDGQEAAYLSRTLAQIKQDLPLTLDLNACRARDFNAQTVDTLFAELDFRSLRDRLGRLKHTAPAQTPDASPLTAADFVQTVIVRDAAGLAALVQTLNAATAIVWDVETTGLDQMAADLVGIALAVDGLTGYYIPVGHTGAGSGTMFADPAPDQLPLATVIEALRPPLTSPHIAKIAHNASFDLVILRRYGLDVTPVVFDSMIAEWVCDPLSRFLGLKNLVRRQFNLTMTDIEALIGKGAKQKSMAVVPVEDAAPYAAADAALTCQLYLASPTPPLRLQPGENALRATLAATDTQNIFGTLEMPLIPVIADMEQAGVLLDLPYLAQMSQVMERDLRGLEERIYQLAGQSFNINSPKQLNEVLFEKLKLSVQGLKKTTQGYSVDVNTLDALHDAHPVIPVILDYRELAKLKSTYVDALPALVNPRTGRVHTRYNQTGTSTGRFSSSNPNLQNIPIRTASGRAIRRAFIAPPGQVLLAVDYSQIELRVMAHLSQDATLLAAFRRGQDIHRATAAAVFGIDPEAVTDEQRGFAKRVNFGLMYGMGAFRLARDSELTLAEADQFIKTYFQQMPGVERYIKETEDRARSLGYVETLLGRRRYFPQLQQGQLNSQAAQAELRAAINMPVQGTAADILKRAMLNLHAALRAGGEPARMILQVHDELVLEVPEDHLERISRLVVDIMEQAYTLDAALVANAESGPNWLEMTRVG
ncbi:MAG: DNA polymerase I [Anaerolineae bacterium]|nr:DNA polymerase I [Anaerolineae bacterium]